MVETLQLKPKPKRQDREPGLKSADSTLAQGTLLQGRYQVIKVLGLGGMGAVYQARDLRFADAQRLCALKEMMTVTHEPQVRHVAVQSFEREANILAALNHAAIPKIFDYFTEGTRAYLVLELVDGMDLEAVLRNTRAALPVELVVAWGAQICDVLAYLHSQKPPIIFRDMKPSNIMIRPNNQIVLIDFGIARVFQSDRKGTMIGTEGYSPPEQYRGIAAPTGDIYALGATLHHLVTGRDPRRYPPFSFHEALPRQLNPLVPEALEAVIVRALAYEAERRFTSAEEMKCALLDSLETEAAPQEVTPPGPQSDPVPPRAKPDPQTGHPQSPGAPASGAGVLPVWHFSCDDEVRSSPVVADGVLYVGSYDNHVYALDARTGGLQWKYPTEGGIAATPCIYKDQVLVGSEDRLLYAISAGNGRILWTCPTGGRIRSSARVEFDHAFFGSDDRHLYAINANNGRIAWRFEALDAVRSTPAIGDELVYVGSEDQYLYAVDLQSGHERWKFRANRAVTSSPLLFNGLVICGASDWTVYALDERSGWCTWRFRTGQIVVGSPRVLDDVVYIGSADGHLYALDAGTGRHVWKFDAGSPVVSTPAVTGDAVYVGTLGGDVLSIGLRSGRERWRYTTGGPVPSSPCCWEGVVYVGSNDHNVYALPA